MADDRPPNLGAISGAAIGGAVAGPVGAAVGAAVGDAVGVPIAAAIKNEVGAFLRGIRDGKLIGLGDPGTVAEIRKSADSAEVEAWAQYLTGTDEKHMVWVGLHLRSIQTDQAEVRRVKDAVREEYSPKHLRLAEAVQAELIDPIITAIRRRAHSPTQAHNMCVALFLDIDKFVLLVETSDKPSVEIASVLRILKLDRPAAFAIAGSGSATHNAEMIANGVQDATIDYDLSEIKDRNRVNYILRLVR